ncbi:MAG: penicillin-binding transpeptidase domain-containing protein [Faecalibacterium sp.]
MWSTAIKWSCNIFFYDVGRRLTSDVYDAYAYKLGLGQRTGVEVSEAVGHLTSKNDSNYMESLDVQAAIGQGNTVVTPIQLATYAATLANNGTRYRTHFVKAILDSNTGEVLQETQPEVMDIIEGTGDTFELVRQGMIGRCPSTITNSMIRSYPITIACKTGTPQRSETYSGSSYALPERHDGGLSARQRTRRSPLALPLSTAAAVPEPVIWWRTSANAYFAMQDGTLNEDGTIGKQETAADSTPADQTAPAQTETGTDTAADTATDPAAGTTDAAQETAPAGQDALDN